MVQQNFWHIRLLRYADLHQSEQSEQSEQHKSYAYLVILSHAQIQI